ncbi:MAG: hypothetical protein KDB07_11525, partial [Planctomycetes bacterium]|nr:hypothetical protein [Planctomycetota bacterium]
ACIVFAIITFSIYGYIWAFLVNNEHPSRKGIDINPFVTCILPLIISFVGGFAGGVSPEAAIVPHVTSWLAFALFSFGAFRLASRLNALADTMQLPVERANPIMGLLGMIPYIGWIFLIVWWFGVHNLHNQIAMQVQAQNRGPGMPMDR